MQNISDILSSRVILKEDTKNAITMEFQSYGLYLAEALDDVKHKALYIRMAKLTKRSLLEHALSFVSDAGARSKGALFMWKVKQLKDGK